MDRAGSSTLSMAQSLAQAGGWYEIQLCSTCQAVCLVLQWEGPERLEQDIRESKTHRPHAKAMDKCPGLGPGAPKWSQPEKGPGLKGAVQVRSAGGTLPGCVTRPRQG